ncbi:hypothetical protein K456DRAFT_1188935 [Colletotrichum gloeosporioides 23]|nr:hypothetical protein K456DRAFT_1188935 [Colletotrichum gloeosporioides 23]
MPRRATRMLLNKNKTPGPAASQFKRGGRLLDFQDERAPSSYQTLSQCAHRDQSARTNVTSVHVGTSKAQGHAIAAGREIRESSFHLRSSQPKPTQPNNKRLAARRTGAASQARLPRSMEGEEKDEGGSLLLCHPHPSYDDASLACRDCHGEFNFVIRKPRCGRVGDSIYRCQTGADSQPQMLCRRPFKTARETVSVKSNRTL